MSGLTPDRLIEIESAMKVIATRNYDRLTRNMWWNKVARKMQSQTKTERLVWFLETAQIGTDKVTGNQHFDQLAAISKDVEHEFAHTGLKIAKHKFEDVVNGLVGGQGLDEAREWTRQVTAKAIYHPQKLLVAEILANPLAYDGQAYFSAAHPLNPFDAAAGTYSNNLTGLDISEAVTVDVALQNLGNAIDQVAQVKQADGTCPRNLVVRNILAPTRMNSRVRQLLNAQSLPQAATGGAGAGDVSAIARNWNLADPIIAPEIGAAYGGSDTTYYLLVEDLASDELGAWGYVEREPMRMRFYNIMDDHTLGRLKQLEWHMDGRNGVTPGHPYLMFRVTA